MKQIELAVVGGGIAGLSCALYAKRAGLEPVLFEKSALGGQLLYIDRIDNYPGLAVHTRGSELIDTLVASVGALSVGVKEEEIIRLQAQKNHTVIVTAAHSYRAQSVAIATGASFKKLGIPGEDRYSGKGVSWCAVCDGYFFKDKDVAVVGGGNTACEDAIYLSNICRKVILIHRRDAFRAMHYLQDELRHRPNVEIVLESTVNEIRGGDFVEEIVVEHTKEKRVNTRSVSGLFIAVGIRPNTDVFQGAVGTDSGGFIVTDETMHTGTGTIWACGDCRKRPLRQLITAASEGAIAALSIYKHIKGHYISV